MRFEVNDELLPSGVITPDDTRNIAGEGCKSGGVQAEDHIRSN
jgi:hypothetical protein